MKSRCSTVSSNESTYACALPAFMSTLLADILQEFSSPVILACDHTRHFLLSGFLFLSLSLLLAPLPTKLSNFLIFRAVITRIILRLSLASPGLHTEASKDNEDNCGQYCHKWQCK